MKRSILILALFALVLSACNLPSTEDEPEETSTETPTELAGFPTLIVRGSETPTVTRTPVATSTQAVIPTACTPRTDWPQYTVVSGDTLSSIAARVGSTASALLGANCLESDLILTGQRLYVPQLPVTATPTSIPASATPTLTPAPPVVGGVSIDQQISGDAGHVFVLRNATANLQYINAPGNLSRVRFWFIYDGGGNDLLIGTDDNAADGYRTTWKIPFGLSGTLTAYGYDDSDSIVVQAYGLHVTSGAAPGQGCRITMNAPTNYYDEPHDIEQPAVGSLNVGDTVETLGRSLAGWWAFDPTGQDGAGGVESLAWIPVDADVTEGAYCG